MLRRRRTPRENLVLDMRRQAGKLLLQMRREAMQHVWRRRHVVLLLRRLLRLLRRGLSVLLPNRRPSVSR